MLAKQLKGLTELCGKVAAVREEREAQESAATQDELTSRADVARDIAIVFGREDTGDLGPLESERERERKKEREKERKREREHHICPLLTVFEVYDQPESRKSHVFEFYYQQVPRK